MLVALAGCAAQPQSQTAWGPTSWGETVNGLQVGIALEVAQAPPGQPQMANGALQGIRVSLRNNGQVPLDVIDPRDLDGAQKNGEPVVMTLTSSGSPALPPGLLFRPTPASVIELIPGQIISTGLGLSLGRGQGGQPVQFSIKYQNSDEVVPVAGPAGANPPPSAHVWTGEAVSGQVQVQ